MKLYWLLLFLIATIPIASAGNELYGITATLGGGTSAWSLAPSNLNYATDGNFTTVTLGSGENNSGAVCTYIITCDSWMQWDIGSAINISNVTFAQLIRDETGNTKRLEYSIDGNSWVVINTDSNSYNGVAPGYDIFINNSYYVNKSMRYIRIYLQSGGGGAYHIKVYEIQAIINNITLNITLPINTSTLSSSTATLQWQEYPQGTPYTYQISTDSQFINIISSGSGSFLNNDTYQATINLADGTHYYWHVKNATSAYTGTWEFTTPGTAIIPGTLNITAFDEQQTSNRISTFSAQIYNSTATLNKSTTTGWVNFSLNEISSGEYLIHILPNSSYAPRYILATPSTTVAAYLPLTSNTIDTVTFVLYDTSNQFPASSTVLQIRQNNTVMYGAYFDTDAQAQVNLIHGQVYQLWLINNNNNIVQNWGSYTSKGTTSSAITVTSIGLNATTLQPFVFNITKNPNNITLAWASLLPLTLSFDIYKGGVGGNHTNVCTTNVVHGQCIFSVTNTSDIYYGVLNYTTSLGSQSQAQYFDYRTPAQNIGFTGAGKIWAWGSYTTPDWMMTDIMLVILIALAGTFGYVFSGLGGILLGITTGFMIWIGWINNISLSSGILAGFLVFSFILYLKERETGMPSMMAYKTALFIICLDLGILVMKTVGIFSDVPMATEINTNSFLTSILLFMPTANLTTVDYLSGSMALVILSISTFSLLIKTLPVMGFIFMSGYSISLWYLGQLSSLLEMNGVFTIVLQILLVFIFVTGWVQWQARESVREHE